MILNMELAGRRKRVWCVRGSQGQEISLAVIQQSWHVIVDCLLVQHVLHNAYSERISYHIWQMVPKMIQFITDRHFSVYQKAFFPSLAQVWQTCSKMWVHLWHSQSWLMLWGWKKCVCSEKVGNRQGGACCFSLPCPRLFIINMKEGNHWSDPVLTGLIVANLGNEYS